MKMSVIMPVYITNNDLYALTFRAIQSLYQSVGWIDCEFIIVDNGSPIGADQLICFNRIYIRNKENVGYPKSVNQGITISNGEYVAVANNDIRVSPNWIEVTNNIFEKSKQAGSLHFKMVEYDEQLNISDDIWETGKERWCTGSFFVLSRQAILEMKKRYGYVLDENYGLGGFDDWDWHHRLNHEMQWKSVYTNRAAYQHKDSSTQNLRLVDERKISDAKNREYFKQKFGKYPETIWHEKYPKQMKKVWRPFP